MAGVRREEEGELRAKRTKDVEAATSNLYAQTSPAALLNPKRQRDSLIRVRPFPDALWPRSCLYYKLNHLYKYNNKEIN